MKRSNLLSLALLPVCKEGVESRFQVFELSCPRKDKTDGQSNVDDDFPGPRRADKLLALRKGFPLRSVMVCPVIICGHTKEIVKGIEFFLSGILPPEDVRIF